MKPGSSPRSFRSCATALAALLLLLAVSASRCRAMALATLGGNASRVTPFSSIHSTKMVSPSSLCRAVSTTNVSVFSRNDLHVLYRARLGEEGDTLKTSPDSVVLADCVARHSLSPLFISCLLLLATAPAWLALPLRVRSSFFVAGLVNTAECRKTTRWRYALKRNRFAAALRVYPDSTGRQ